MLFPSPLVGEGGEIEWNEIEPGEGALMSGCCYPSPASRLCRSAPSPARGEGKKD